MILPTWSPLLRGSQSAAYKVVGKEAFRTTHCIFSCHAIRRYRLL
jgi:hypothetical protein